MDVSGWWVLAAFLIGGYAGALLVALMAIAAHDGGNSATVEGGGGIAADPVRPRFSI